MVSDTDTAAVADSESVTIARSVARVLFLLDLETEELDKNDEAVQARWRSQKTAYIADARLLIRRLERRGIVMRTEL